MCALQRHALGLRRCLGPPQREAARNSRWRQSGPYLRSVQFVIRAVQASLIYRIATHQQLHGFRDIDIGDCLEYTFGPDNGSAPSRNSALRGTG